MSKLDDIDKISDEIQKTLNKKETGKTDVNKDKFKKTRAAHTAEIEKIKAQRAKLKQDIKKHKLLIKQAKLCYKLDKLKKEK